jgi:hypothetical protein
MKLLTEEARQVKKETPPNLINLARRATKSVPDSGVVWSAYLRLLETNERAEIQDLETVSGERTALKPKGDPVLKLFSGAYERAMTMNILQSSPDDFALVVMARAAWRRRQCFALEGGEVPFG